MKTASGNPAYAMTRMIASREYVTERAATQVAEA